MNIQQYFNTEDWMYSTLKGIMNTLAEDSENNDLCDATLRFGDITNVQQSGRMEYVMVTVEYCEPYEDNKEVIVLTIPVVYVTDNFDKEGLKQWFRGLAEAERKRHQIDDLTNALMVIPNEVLQEKYQRDIFSYSDMRNLATEILEEHL
jgi:hypothetical protein